MRLLTLLLIGPLAACAPMTDAPSSDPDSQPTPDAAPEAASDAASDAASGPAPSPDAPVTPEPSKEALATFGAGCFWCVEAVYLQVDGVSKAVSGYMGGHVEDPTYRAVCTGSTGHAEVVQLTYDPSVVSFAQLCEWFFRLHDPTTLNRQGADVGTQYRSAIFFHDEEQQRVAQDVIRQLEEAKAFDDPIVTEVSAATTFYVAEDYHQDYYMQNRSQGYCRAVIRPKLLKLGLKD